MQMWFTVFIIKSTCTFIEANSARGNISISYRNEGYPYWLQLLDGSTTSTYYTIIDAFKYHPSL